MMKSSIFWNVTPCSLLKDSQRFDSETSVDFQQTAWSYVPEDRILHKHRCEGLKSYNLTDVIETPFGYTAICNKKATALRVSTYELLKFFFF
jgi:hypothetical protein